MKSLPPENVLVRPFVTYKTHTYEHTFLSASNPAEIIINEALEPPSAWRWEGATEPVNTGSIVAKRPLYSSLKQLFYPEVSLKYKVPHQITSGSTILLYSGSWEYTATGSLRRSTRDDLGFSLPTGSVYVLNVAQAAFGEQIWPGSFKVQSPASTASIYDDGNGRLVSSPDPNSVIGNIFYGSGIAVLQKGYGPSTASIVSNTGLYLDTGSVVSVQYQSQYTIFEHMVICTMNRGEFNFSTNSSLQTFTSSSIGGSTKLFDALLSGSLTPYFTTIGLYTSAGEMVAIAKVPHPIRRLVDSDQTVVIKFDI